MSIIVDLLIVAILGLFIFLGYKRGLIGVAFKMFSFVIAIVIAFILYKPISGYIIEHTTWDDSLTSSIQEMIKGDSDQTINQEKVEATPNVISNYINSAVEKAVLDAKSNVAQAVSQDIAINIIRAATIIALFIIARIILFFLKALSDIIADLPIVKQFNDLGGIIYGVLEGILIIFVLLGIISLFFSHTAITQAITTSSIGSILYNNNLLLMLFF